MNKKNRFEFSVKIWFSIGILVFSYFLSTVFTYYIGQNTEKQLELVSDTLFHANMKSHQVNSAFKDETRYYNDAVLRGEYNLIDMALSSSEYIQLEMDSILALKGLDPGKIVLIKSLKKDLYEYSHLAHQVYKKMIYSPNYGEETLSESDQTEMKNQAAYLNQKNSELQAQLISLATDFAEQHRNVLEEVSMKTHRYRRTTLITFFVVAILSLALIHFYIFRSVIKPLEKTTMLEQAMEQSVDGIAVIDFNSRFKFVNSAFASMHAFPTAGLIGQHIRCIFDEAEYENTLRPIIEKLVAMEEAFEGQLNHRRGQIETFPTKISLSLFENRKGKPVGILCIVRDITLQQQAEEQLKQAKEQSEAANRSKSEFLANMSHEIRTPMNGVLGMLDLMMDTQLNQEQQEYAEIAKISAESLLDIINDILDYSKIEAGLMDFEIIDFDMRGMIENMAQTLAIKAQKKGFDLACLVNSDVPSMVCGDPTRLRQVLINLIGNAIKFTSKGGVFLQIYLEEDSEDKVKLKFLVKDTGIGISSEARERLFQSFSQADASTTRKYGGTGLGLAISKQLVEMMDGEIGVQSDPGVGSTFWFTAVLGKQSVAKDSGTLVFEEIKNEKFLIVDDNHINRKVFKEQLMQWGGRVEEAADSDYALKLLKNAAGQDDPFRVVLIDMQIAQMGAELLGQAIKADPELQKTAMVMVTSFAKRGDAGRLEEIGFSAFLTKPIKRNQLRDCLQMVLGITAQNEGEKKSSIITRHSLNEARKSRIRILVAEDNLVNQKLITRVLEKVGYHIDTVENGRDALRALESFEYDIVLMDVQMPVMDGFETTLKVRDSRSAVKNHKIPIIALTAHAMKGDKEKSMEAGMNDHITKPIQPDKLFATIEKHLPLV